MRGILIYDTAGKRRNEWFISRLIESAKIRGCELELVIYEDGVKEPLTPPPDFAIVRTIRPELNKMLEELGIVTFNNHVTSRVANDKWQTAVTARELGIEIMDTAPLGSDEADSFEYPLVLKAVDGHGGNEVFLVNNPEEARDIASANTDKRFILQRLCDEPGVDMRVYVMGEKIVAATKRISKTDFRSNFSLGGSAETDTPTNDMISTINKLHTALDFDFVGVDFIRNSGRWVLNEIEDVVGTRMLYSLTDIDAADKYIEYILGKLKENLCTTN